MAFRKYIGKIHLWLGLTSGLVVFIVSLTGCIYAFKDEIQACYRFDRTVSETGTRQLKPTEVIAIARKYIPKHKVHSINYGKPHEAIEVSYYETRPEYYYTAVYIHPTSGKILGSEDLRFDFFQVILQGHFNLWLPRWIGQPIVASATLIFALMVLTGIILWWPKNKNARQQRFKLKWKKTTGKKRKNYDLHTVFGFYASVIALVFALTGLVWGFQWFAKGTYRLIGGKKSMEYAIPNSTGKGKQEDEMIDHLYQRLQPEYQDKAASVEYHVPETKETSIYVYVRRDPGTYYRSDYRYFDQYTGKELNVKHLWGKYGDATNSDKLFRMNYDIHVGAIGGLAGKILAFCISLVCASLPVTGFYIWRWRKKKSVKKQAGKIVLKNL